MEEQGLRPGVQDGKEAPPGLEPALRYLEDRLGGGGEQKPISELAVCEEERVQPVRDREHDMEVRDR